MGEMGSQIESIINHFSHPHPLHLSNHQPQQTLNLPSCSACKLKSSGLVYTCLVCNYFLHIKCSKMPQQITHPFDQNHIFSLLPTPIYPEGYFNCDACGKHGNGFSYHCEVCNFDLHINCASMPLFLSHHSHHHQLNLTFTPPYNNKGFSCDICKKMGSNFWLYRCSMCEFDAHLTCATSKPIGPVRGPVQYPVQQIEMQQCQTVSRDAPQSQVLGNQYAVRPPLQNPSVYGSVGPIGSEPGNVVLNQVLQGLASGVSQSAGQALMHGLVSGDGGHALSSGGGGGGGNLLNAISGGGGGGNVLHALVGGGGGGSDNSGGVDGFGDNGGALDGGSFLASNDSFSGIDGGFGDSQDFSF